MKAWRWLGLLCACWVGMAAADERGAPLTRLFDLQEEVDTYTPAVDLLELADGRLLVVTIGGIAVFDGVRWFDARHPRALTGVERATLGADGRVHLGFDGDFGWFAETARGRFEWHSEAERWPAELVAPGKFINSFLLDDERTVLHVGRNSLVRLDAAGSASGLPAPSPWGYAHRVGDQLWLQTIEGRLSRLDLNGPLVLQPMAELEAVLGVRPNGRLPYVRNVVPDDAGGWLMLISDGRILRHIEGRYEPWPTPATELLQAYSPYAMSRLRDGRLVLLSFAHRPVLVRSDGRIDKVFTADDGVPLRVSNRALEDRQGGLWLAQALAVVRIDLASGITLFGEAQGLPAGTQSLQRWQGELYATGGPGLFRLVPGEGARGGRFEPVLPERLAAVPAAVADGERLLLSGRGLQALRRDGEGWSLVSLLDLPLSNDLVTSRRLPGRYWLTHPKGVQQIDSDAAGQLQIAPLAGVDWPVLRLAEAPDGSLWLADQGGGLWHWRGAGDIRRYGPEQGLPASTIRLYSGREQTWFATLTGVMVHDAASDRFVWPQALPAILRERRIFSLLEDAHGHLWLRGDEVTGVIWSGEGERTLDRSPLLAVSMRPTINAFLREGDVLWAARARGVLRLDLAERQPLLAPAAPLLTQIRGPAGPLSTAALVDLPATVRELRLGFGSPDLHRSEALQFRARLAGFETDFPDWSGEAQRIYTNLPDGRYTLELQSRDGYGREAAASPIPITIAAPWFRTPLAYAGYLAAAVLALLLAAQIGARRRQRRLLTRQRELETEVERRTQQIASQAEQLQQQATRLADLDRLKTDFFVNIGHEFRTPLTLVLGPLDDVLRDPRTRLGERTREQLELALRNARRVLDLIVELLDVNRLEQGQLPLKPVVADFPAWLRGQLAELGALVERHGHALQLRLGEVPLPSAFDPLLMARVLANLLGNACKFMPRGGTIEVELAADGQQLQLSIRDHGCGIDVADLPHIFDRFHRASSAQVEGYGVGLALAREIIERHGGRIWAESSPGEGTRMVLELPLMAADAGTADAAPDAALASPLPGATGAVPEAASGAADADPDTASGRERPRVLVVEDHDDLRQRLQQLLASRYEVLIAADGPQALTVAQQRLPDVVVSDVMMPGFDGVELTRRLRAHPETRPIGVLLLTAKAGAEHAVVGLQAGADDFLAKPFDAAELLARVGAILAHARRLQMRMARSAPPAPLPSRPARDQQWLQRLEGHIEARLHDSEFDVEALAAAMHMERSALFRHLKQHSALGPAELLRERRLLRARQLLQSGAGSVTEVAFAVGFDTLSGFTRAFRGQFGQTPSALLPSAAQR